MPSPLRRALAAAALTALVTGAGVLAAAPAWAAETLGNLTAPAEFVENQPNTVTLDLEIPPGVPPTELPFQIRVLTNADSSQATLTAQADSPLTNCIVDTPGPPQPANFNVTCAWPNSAVGQTAQLVLTLEPVRGYSIRPDISFTAYQATPNQGQSAPLAQIVRPVVPPTAGAVQLVKNTSAATNLRPDPAQLLLSCDDGQGQNLIIPPGESTGSTNVITTTTEPVTCSVLEQTAGGAGNVDVTTSATLSISGGPATPYTLESDFTVELGDSIVVTVDNDLALLPGNFQVIKLTTFNPTDRPDPAVIEYACTDSGAGVRGGFTVPVFLTSGSSGFIPVSGSASCTVTEPQTGATSGAVTVTTDAALVVNGALPVAYTLGTPFPVNPGDTVGVLIGNSFNPTPATLLISKQTTANSTARPQPAVIAYTCDNGVDGQFTVPAGATTADSGAISVGGGAASCVVTESQTGAASGATVRTTATLSLNGLPTPYRLGDSFTVNPGDQVAVDVVNAVTASSAPPTPVTPPAPSGLANTGYDSPAQPYLVAGALLAVALGGGLIGTAALRRRQHR